MAGFLLQARARGRDPPDPPTLHTVVPNWSPGDTIPLGSKTLRVIEVRDDSDRAVLIVEPG